VNEGQTDTQKTATNWKRRAGLLLVLLVVGVGALLRRTLVPREPSYQGKPLSYWLLRAAESGAFYNPKDPQVVECREAIRSIGTNAIPTLLRILKAKDSPVKRAVMNLAEKQSYVALPIHSVEEHSPKAVIGFYLLGDLATNAVPALIEIYKHSPSPSSRAIAGNELMRLYPAKSVSVPYWVVPEKQAEWYIQAGMGQAESDAPSNAVLAFSEAIRLEPTNSLAYSSRAGARLELEDITGALGDYDKSIELSPSNSTAISGRGMCRFGLKDFRGAEADFTSALNLESNNTSDLNFRGLARANLREFKPALEDFDKAIESSAYDASGFRNRAMVEGMQTDFELALADVSKALDLDNKDALAWATRARIQSALKNYHSAITDADRAIQLDARDSGAYAIRATARMYLDEFADSAADLETALRLNPNNASALCIRGLLKAKRGGEDEAALADLEHAVELAPKVPETVGMLGLFQYKISKWKPALANCRKALELGAMTSVSSYHAYIWLIRTQSGEAEAANSDLETYLKSLDTAKTNDWSAITARFLIGSLPESNFLRLATTAAKRPSAVTNQVCESLYYAAMKRKIAGDKPGALELLQKCLDTKDDNTMAYLNAGVELRAMKGQ
jgi:tetratricopeptide (TPR) repeat protein